MNFRLEHLSLLLYRNDISNPWLIRCDFVDAVWASPMFFGMPGGPRIQFLHGVITYNPYKWIKWPCKRVSCAYVTLLITGSGAPPWNTGNLISLPSIFGYLIWSEHGLMLCNFSNRPWAISMSIWSATTWRWRWLETWVLLDFWGWGNSCGVVCCLHSWRLTWNLQITRLERKMIFQTSMIVFHVNLPGCSGFLFVCECFGCGWFHHPVILLMYFWGAPSEDERCFAKKAFLMWIDGVWKRMNHVSICIFICIFEFVQV